MHRAQRRAVEARARPGRPHSVLAAANESLPGRTWEVPCADSGAGGRDGVGSSGISAAPARCARLVWDSFADATEVTELRASMDRGFEGIVHSGPEVLLAPSVAVLGRLGATGLELTEALVERCRKAVERTLAPPSTKLRTTGALLKRLRLPVSEGTLQGEPWHDPHAPHADRVKREAYEYSALLYLGSAGTDFGGGSGGNFVFHDPDMDRVIPPVAGRLVAFTGGLENLHSALPMAWGARHTLAVWFARETTGVDRRSGGSAGTGSGDGGLSAAELAAPTIAVAAVAALIAELASGAWRACPTALVGCLRNLCGRHAGSKVSAGSR